MAETITGADGAEPEGREPRARRGERRNAGGMIEEETEENR